jgi:hypothetical protein
MIGASQRFLSILAAFCSVALNGCGFLTKPDGGSAASPLITDDMRNYTRLTAGEWLNLSPISFQRKKY